MTDRELLELAAKAAGFNFKWFKVKQWKNMKGKIGPYRYFTGTVDVYGSHHTKPWSPLTDDRDALRLAVELRIDVSHDEVGMKSFVYARTVFNDETHIGLSEIFDDESERLDRTRRAITRAAAQIGKDMQ